MGQSAVAIELAWEAPQHDGGSDITAYRLEMSQGVVFPPDLHCSRRPCIWTDGAVHSSSLTGCGLVCSECSCSELTHKLQGLRRSTSEF